MSYNLPQNLFATICVKIDLNTLVNVSNLTFFSRFRFNDQTYVNTASFFEFRKHEVCTRTKIFNVIEEEDIAKKGKKNEFRNIEPRSNTSIMYKEQI